MADLNDIHHEWGELNLSLTLLGMHGSIDDTNERLEELVKLMKELIQETKKK